MKKIYLQELIDFFESLLQINSIPDKSNNGLQIEGNKYVTKIVFAVDASLKLFEHAADTGAEFVFVHHGISWGDELKRIKGGTAKRVRFLLKNNISLYAAHLPLDCHPCFNHNILIANKLSLLNIRNFAKIAGVNIGICGEFQKPVLVKSLSKTLDKMLGGESKIFGNKACEIRKVAIIAGSPGVEAITEAERQKIDCFVTGEVHHSSFHTIQESGLSVIAAGHYATERPGVLAVMDFVSKKLKLKTEFFELPTGL